MNVRPRHDRLLVKRLDGEERTQGRLVIPDTAKEQTLEGRIVAVGEGTVDEVGRVRPLDLFRGQRVLFDRCAGTEIGLDGDAHMIIREADVLAVLE
jgi:chaperonin GroES